MTDGYRSSGCGDVMLVFDYAVSRPIRFSVVAAKPTFSDLEFPSHVMETRRAGALKEYGIGHMWL